MPCSDSSSNIVLRLDSRENFVSFDFAKITCGREITAQTGYCRYCTGKSLREILDVSYDQAAGDLHLQDEETRFILHLEWDALRSAIAQYLGVDDADTDRERCQITSIEHDEDGIRIVEVILPPKEMPKILPCSLADSSQH